MHATLLSPCERPSQAKVDPQPRGHRCHKFIISYSLCFLFLGFSFPASSHLHSLRSLLSLPLFPSFLPCFESLESEIWRAASRGQGTPVESDQGPPAAGVGGGGNEAACAPCPPPSKRPPPPRLTPSICWGDQGLF